MRRQQSWRRNRVFYLLLGVGFWLCSTISAGAAGLPELVKDIFTGSNAFPQYLTNVNGTLFFSALDSTNGEELWKSDGTAAGTVLVQDIVPGSDSSYPRYLTDVNGTLFFSAQHPATGNELWRLSSAAPGTIIIDKVTIPFSSLELFDFTDTIIVPNTFALGDGDSITFTDVVPGSYTVAEDDPTTSPSGFELVDIVCDEDITSNSSGNVANREVTIELESGETVACTFVNRPVACNADGDANIDRDDINLIFAAHNTPASGPDDPRDVDGNGTITVNDARACVLQCNNPQCAP